MMPINYAHNRNIHFTLSLCKLTHLTSHLPNFPTFAFQQADNRVLPYQLTLKTGETSAGSSDTFCLEFLSLSQVSTETQDRVFEDPNESF